MKTAEELFLKHTGNDKEYLKKYTCLISYDNFCNSLTEHDQEIIKMIDEMIRINELEIGAGSELNADWRIGKGESLKELRSKL